MKEEKNHKRDFNYKKIVFAIILEIIIYSFYSQNGVFSWAYRVDASFIVLPSITVIGIYIFSELIAGFFEGKLVSSLKVSLHFLMIGIFMFLLLRSTPSLSPLESAAEPILYISILVSLYYLFSSGLEENTNLSTGLKSVTLVVLGFFFRNLSLSAFPSKIEIFGETIATLIANVLFIGFIFVAGGIIIFHKNEQSSFLSIEKDTFYTVFFTIGGFIGFYIFGLRTSLTEIIGSRVLLLEWTVVIGLGILGAAKIVQNIRNREKTEEHWTPHQKVEKVLQDRSREEILKALDEFLENGSKERMLVYLVFRESRKGKNWVQIFEEMKELLEYKDLEPSPIISRWTKESVSKKNKERRKKALEKTIEKIEEE